jgi:putative ABC transport system permease protein
MPHTKKLPLAVLQLRDSPVKTAAAAAGICFSNVLVFFQLGLLNAIYQSQDRPYSLLDGEIVLVSSRFSRLSQTPVVWRADIMRAQGVEGVDKVSLLSIGLVTVLVVPTGYTTNAQVYGIDPSNPALDPNKAKLDLSLLDLYERAAIDTLSRPSYVNNVNQAMKASTVYQTNIGSNRLLINSKASIGSTFASDLSLIMSQDNFLHYLPGRNPSQTNIGVVRVRKGVSATSVLDTLQRTVYPKGYHIQALSLDQVSNLEIVYWQTHTALTFIFGLGVIVGFIVSGIILYQILFSDVIAHLAEYATLLALGYTNSYVIRVVFTQALLLVLLSFPFSLAISVALYSVMSTATNLVIYMTVGRASLVLLLSSATSMASCYLATNQLRKVDPSTLY